MSRLVLDASVPLELLLGQERAALAGDVLDQVVAVAPSHWRTELTNGLVTQLRRKTITRAQAEMMLNDAHELGVESDHHGWTAGWTAVLSLAADRALTAYHAAYLELALRLGPAPRHLRRASCSGRTG